MIDPKLFAFINNAEWHITSMQKLLLYGLAHYWEPKLLRSSPTIGELAIFCHCTVSTIYINLKALQESGYIGIHRAKGSHRSLRVTIKAFELAQAARDEDIFAPIFFDIFWDEYPNKNHKNMARRAMEELNPTSEQQNQMLDAIAHHKLNKFEGKAARSWPQASSFIRKRTNWQIKI